MLLQNCSFTIYTIIWLNTLKIFIVLVLYFILKDEQYKFQPYWRGGGGEVSGIKKSGYFHH